MSPESVLIVALLLNALNVLVVLYLVYKGSKILDEFQPYLKDVEGMRHTIVRRGNEVLEKTIGVAQEIVRNAATSAANNLKVSQSLHDEVTKGLKDSIEQNRSETQQIVQKAVKEIVDGYLDQFTNLSKEIESAGTEAHNRLLQTAESELTTVSKVMQDRLDKIMAEAEKNITEYREVKIKELDTKIYQVLGEVAKKTIGHSIDLTSHEDLVMQALEKAKKEKLFS